MKKFLSLNIPIGLIFNYEKMDKENYYKESKNLPQGLKLLRFYFKYIGKFFPRFSGLIFWKMFCMPKKREIKQKHKLFLISAESNYINFQNKRIAAYKWGEGQRKILFVHGWEGMTADFKDLINSLSKEEYTIVSIDLPAHGNSSGKRTNIPMIMNLLKKVIEMYGPFYGIVSHSLGAAASALTIAEFNGSSKLSKLVLMGLHPYPFNFFEQFRQLLKIDKRLFKLIINYIELKINLKLNEFSVPDKKEKISVDNVLLIHDENDEVIHIDKIRMFNAEWEKSELFTGKHGGHFKHYNHNDVIHTIKEFMAN